MALLTRIRGRLGVLKVLTPGELKKLAQARIEDIIQGEIPRARRRIDALTRRHPHATPREIAQRLIDKKKTLATKLGGITGFFGFAALPADLLVMAWLELTLTVDVATLYEANLKTSHGRQELLDVLGLGTGHGPLKRASPRVLGKLAAELFERTGFRFFGRAVPLIAAPLSAYLDRENIQRVGEQAVRHYEGFAKAREKNRKGDAEPA